MMMRHDTKRNDLGDWDWMSRALSVGVYYHLIVMEFGKKGLAGSEAGFFFL